MDIFNNPLIKKIALGKLKSYMKENNISLIAVTIKSGTDEIDFEPYTEEVVIIPAREMEEIKSLITQNIKA